MEIRAFVIGGCGPRGFFEYESGTVPLARANTVSLARALREGGAARDAALAELRARSPRVHAMSGDEVTLRTEDSYVLGARRGAHIFNPSGELVCVSRADADAIGVV